MKNLKIGSLVGVVLLIAQSASAGAPRTKSGAYAEQVRTQSAAPADSHFSMDSTNSKFGLGVAAASNVTDTLTAVSAYFILAPQHALQFYFGIGQTSPFDFGIGANYKFTLVGSQTTGFHIGAGFGLGKDAFGNKAPFFFNINGLGGFHFIVPSVREIMFSFDFGPSIQIRDGDADFVVGALSSLVGISVHYLF